MRSIKSQESPLKVGQLYMKAIVHQPVQGSEIPNAILNCFVSDFRDGRKPNSKRSFGFIHIMDATGTLSLGANYVETALHKQMLPSTERSDLAFCSFEATIRGRISWQPSKADPNIPNFMLNTGSIEKTSHERAHRINMLLPPSGDVLNFLVSSKFFPSQRHKILSFLGRIDDIITENGAFHISVEDNCDFVAVNIDDTDDPAQFVNDNGLEVGSLVELSGALLQRMPDEQRAVLKLDLASGDIHVINEKEFSKYNTNLLGLPNEYFMFGKPDPISSRPSPEEQ